MTAASHTDEPDPVPRRPAGGSRLTKIVAAVLAVAALAFGANAIAKSDSSTSASGAPDTQSAAPAGPQGAAGGRFPGMGGEVTGATLTKLEALVLARYPGTVEHAMTLGDGSYVVHVIRAGGAEVHVAVSTDFKITGVQQGGPGAGAPPSGQPAPSATPSGANS